MRILILGGTTEGTALAQRLMAMPGLEIRLSLAGRTKQPAALPLEFRKGGFGGVKGLIEYLQTEAIDAVIDATHPFAAQISHHAARASEITGMPRLLLVRSPWEKLAGDRWTVVRDCAQAAAALDPDDRIFLTIGRQEVEAFAHLEKLWFLMRMIDPPEGLVPPGEVLLDRGPFNLNNEINLLKHYKITVMVSKNSGGEATYAKILAARELGIPVVMIDRPEMPHSENIVGDVDGAIHWIKQYSGQFGELVGCSIS